MTFLCLQSPSFTFLSPLYEVHKSSINNIIKTSIRNDRHPAHTSGFQLPASVHQKTQQLLAASTDKEEGLQALSNQIPHKVEFYKMQTSTKGSVQQCSQCMAHQFWHQAWTLDLPRNLQTISNTPTLTEIPQIN